MPLTHNPKTAIQTNIDGDSKYNVVTQSPESILQTLGGLGTPTASASQIAVGQEFTLVGRVGIAANSPAASTTYTVQWYNKDCPYKLKVLEVGFRVVDITADDYTDGDAGNLDLTVIRGDGAASETETDILADFAMDDDYGNGNGDRFPSATVALANDEVVSGGSLKAQLIVDPDATAGATNDGAEVDVWVRCLRVL